MNKIFKDQISRSVKVYVDDMIVKSMSLEQHLADMKELFLLIWQYQMKLNPAKCAFFIQGGEVLGIYGKWLRYRTNSKKGLGHLRHA